VGGDVHLMKPADRTVRSGSHQITATAQIPVLMIFIILIRLSSRFHHVMKISWSRIRRSMAEMLVDLLAYKMRIQYFHQIEKKHRPHRSRVMIRVCVPVIRHLIKMKLEKRWTALNLQTRTL
jgi:hypothetical protein